MKANKILSVDFGTSCTVFAITNTTSQFEPEIVEIDGKPFIETILRLNQEGDIELFGTEAWEQIDDAPERTYLEFKMCVGQSGVVKTGSGITEGQLSSRELGIIFLRRCREKIERQHFNSTSLADQELTTVIGYPAAWTEKQREETLIIAAEAGFPNVQGCAEPVGAIYYHHYKGDLSLEKNQTILVYDFGGGTSDVAVVRTERSKKPNILSVGGTRDLGGRNFNESIYHFLIEQAGIDKNQLNSSDIVSMRRVARQLKEKLSAAVSDNRESVESTITLHGLKTQKRLQLTVQDFERTCKALIQRFPDPIWEALNRADVAPKNITVSILAGGSARMHYTRKVLDEVIPDSLKLQSVSPAEVVAKGLAIFGQISQNHNVLSAQRPESTFPSESLHRKNTENSSTSVKTQSGSKSKISKSKSKNKPSEPDKGNKGNKKETPRKKRIFNCPPALYEDMIASTQDWLIKEGFKTQRLELEDGGGLMLQIER